MYCRQACSIPDPSSASVLVTGGYYYALDTVSRYGLEGCTVLYCTVLYCIVLYCTVLYCVVLQVWAAGMD